MNVYKTLTMGERLTGNPYAGRGIVIGKTADGKKAAVAYFIMGRRSVFGLPEKRRKEELWRCIRNCP